MMPAIYSVKDVDGASARVESPSKHISEGYHLHCSRRRILIKQRDIILSGPPILYCRLLGRMAVKRNKHGSAGPQAATLEAWQGVVRERDGRND